MKPAIFHPKALETLRTFPEDIRRAFGKALSFHAFAKKTQKTPMHELDLGRKRLKGLCDEES